MEHFFQYLVTGLSALAAQAAPILEQNALALIEAELQACLSHVQAAKAPKA